MRRLAEARCSGFAAEWSYYKKSIINAYFSKTNYAKMKGTKHMTNNILYRFRNLGREHRINRRYKDQLFRLIFNNKQDRLELYNAIHSTYYQDSNDLIITTIHDAVYLGMKNECDKKRLLPRHFSIEIKSIIPVTGIFPSKTASWVTAGWVA